MTVVLLPSAACTPLEGSNASLLDAHEGGVRSQSVLDGSIAPGVGSSADDASLADSADSAEAAVAVEAAAPARDEATTATQPSTPAETSSPPAVSAPPVVVKSGDEDIDSGEYIPPAGVFLQVPLPTPGQGEVNPDDGALPSEESLEAMDAKGSLPDTEEASVADEAPMLADAALAELVRGPSTDQGGLEAIAALAHRAAVEENPAAPETDSGLASKLPCLPSGPSLLTTAARDFTMVRAWVEGGELRGELRDPEGRLYPVVQGDRVGPDGGRVVRITRNEIVVGAIGFDLEGSPVIVQEVRRLAP